MNNWAQYTSTCTGTLNGDWCVGPVTATITDADISTASAVAPAYLVGMVCSVQGGEWKCACPHPAGTGSVAGGGCRDTTCSNFFRKRTQCYSKSASMIDEPTKKMSFWK